MKTQKSQNKPSKVTIMGLGVFGGGIGAAEYFARQGCEVTVTDLKSQQQLADSVAKLRNYPVTLHLGEHRQEDFTEADLVVVSPAVPRESKYIALARERNVPLKTEISLFFELCAAPIVGITGSNGKTTTTTMIGNMLERSGRRTYVGGNIGGSLLSRVDEIQFEDVVVLELSSFQLEWLGEAGVSPQISVVTNINPNHLDRHKTMENYIAAKRHIIAHQNSDGTAILNYDDATLRTWPVERDAVWFSANGLARTDVEGCFARDGKVMLRRAEIEHELAPLSALGLPGKHNLQNALAAAAAAFLAGATPDGISAALADFTGIEHRLEYVRTANGVSFYNDSKATTPESAMAALDSFDAPLVLIAGGYDKHTPFDALAKKIRRQARAVVLIGQTADKIAELVNAETDGASAEFTCLRADNLEEAVDAAAKLAAEGDVVVMSPACASYDMFPNYEERGRQFKELVAKL